MKKLSELLKLRKIQQGLFGIEIECEGVNLPAVVPDEWEIKDDGSLRGRFPRERAEYVLRSPLNLKQAIDSVKSLRKHVDDNRGELNFSFRTSVHVHMNVTDLTTDQYLNVVYTYLLLENTLTRYCGNERIGNRFCLRLQDAEGFVDTLSNVFRNGVRYILDLNMEGLKYAAINIAATPKYGSIEFRAMQGNMEIEYISTWLKALNNIKEFAKQFDSPRQIHDFFVKSDPSQFMQSVLKDTYPSFSYEDEVSDMRLAFSLTLELPYTYENARDRINRAEKEIENKKKEMLEQVEAHVARMRRDLIDGDNEYVRDHVNGLAYMIRQNNNNVPMDYRAEF